MFRSLSAEPRARALLVCIADRRLPREPRRARPPGALELSGATLLRRWEATGLPFVVVERDLALLRTASAATAAGPPRVAGEAGHIAPWPMADGLLLRSERPSLLRDPSFVRLFERLGGPLLILLGDELGDLAMETAVDGFLAGHPIIVVKDAWPFPLEDETEISSARAAALPLLSCFARLMGASELARDWTGAG